MRGKVIDQIVSEYSVEWHNAITRLLCSVAYEEEALVAHKAPQKLACLGILWYQCE